MDYLIIFIFGFVTGFMLLRAIVQYRVKQFKDILESVIEKNMPQEVGIVFSKQGDLIQVHNSVTQEFLAQGTTKEEIVKLLEERYPNIAFKANSKNMEEMGLK